MSGPFNNQIRGATINGPQGFSGGGTPFTGSLPVGGAFNLYNLGGDTTTDFERLNIAWTANSAFIQTQAGGAGIVRSLFLGSTGAVLKNSAAGGNGFEFLSSIGLNTVPTAIDLVLTNGYTVVYVDATASARLITLPAAGGVNLKRFYIIKKIDASANAVTIQGNGAELIDGANTKVLATQFAFVQIHSNGTQWFVIG